MPADRVKRTTPLKQRKKRIQSAVSSFCANARLMKAKNVARRNILLSNACMFSSIGFLMLAGMLYFIGSSGMAVGLVLAAGVAGAWGFLRTPGPSARIKIGVLLLTVSGTLFVVFVRVIVEALASLMKEIAS